MNPAQFRDVVRGQFVHLIYRVRVARWPRNTFHNISFQRLSGYFNVAAYSQFLGLFSTTSIRYKSWAKRSNLSPIMLPSGNPAQSHKSFGIGVISRWSCAQIREQQDTTSLQMKWPSKPRERQQGKSETSIISSANFLRPQFSSSSMDLISAANVAQARPPKQSCSRATVNIWVYTCLYELDIIHTTAAHPIFYIPNSFFLTKKNHQQIRFHTV